MGEANFYYFTCLKLATKREKIQRSENRDNCIS